MGVRFARFCGCIIRLASAILMYPGHVLIRFRSLVLRPPPYFVWFAVQKQLIKRVTCSDIHGCQVDIWRHGTISKEWSFIHEQGQYWSTKQVKSWARGAAASPASPALARPLYYRPSFFFSQDTMKLWASHTPEGCWLVTFAPLNTIICSTCLQHWHLFLRVYR